MRTSFRTFVGALVAAGALVSSLGVASAAASPTSASAGAEPAPAATISVSIDVARMGPLMDWWW